MSDRHGHLHSPWAGGGGRELCVWLILSFCCVEVSVSKNVQHVAEQNVRHNHAYFNFWHGSCQFFFFGSQSAKFFLAAKTTFGSWHAGTCGIHTGFNIFGSESVFGRILPKIQVGTISAKNKSWQTHTFFLLFARTHCHSLCNRATHTTPKTQNIQPHPTTKHVIITAATASSVAACAPGNRRRGRSPPRRAPDNDDDYEG
jgi:hypothetical protein